MADRAFKVRALGEVAIRCRNHPEMVAFYRDVIGLTPLRRIEDAPIVFFKISNGFEGHTTVLALFPCELEGSNSKPVAGPGSSLHHIALTLPYHEQQKAIRWYDHLGLDYKIENFDWIGWRGIFTQDPDGNTVELVAQDPEWRGATRGS